MTFEDFLETECNGYGLIWKKRIQDTDWLGEALERDMRSAWNAADRAAREHIVTTIESNPLPDPESAYGDGYVRAIKDICGIIRSTIKEPT